MFSTTLCLASTSQPATMTAPTAPHGQHPLGQDVLGVQTRSP